MSQPEVRRLCGKVPDALLVTPYNASDPDCGGWIEAVEVEQAKKGQVSLIRCLQLAELASKGASVRGFKLRGVVFVFENHLSHASRIARVAEKLWPSAEQRARFSKYVRLVSVATRPPLVFGEWQTWPLKI